MHYTIEGTRTPLHNDYRGWTTPTESLLGDLYGGMLHIIPPFLWWGTGSWLVALMAFVGLSLLTLWGTYRFFYRIIQAFDWILRRLAGTK